MSITETDCPHAMHICPQSTCTSANRSRPDRSRARWGQPAARTDHICTMKGGSEAKQSLRQSSGAAESDSTVAVEIAFMLEGRAIDGAAERRRSRNADRPARLLDVLHPRRYLAERLLRQRCFHELIEIAVEHTTGIRRGHAGAQIFHHLIGLQHVR